MITDGLSTIASALTKKMTVIIELKEKILGKLHEDKTKMEISESDENLFKSQLYSQHVKVLTDSI